MVLEEKLLPLSIIQSVDNGRFENSFWEGKELHVVDKCLNNATVQVLKNPTIYVVVDWVRYFYTNESYIKAIHKTAGYGN